VVGRLSTYEGPAEEIDRVKDGFERLTDELRTMDGFEHAYLLVDRATGEAMTLTIWDNEAAAESSAERAKEMREEVAAAAQAGIKSVQNYEIALRVPRLTDS
jgi:heme-degrading monooxygenase HmoA